MKEMLKFTALMFAGCFGAGAGLRVGEYVFENSDEIREAISKKISPAKNTVKE